MSKRLAQFSLAALLASGSALAAEEQEVVAIDLERYLGTWYDIAHVPFYFQRGCTGTTATYTKGAGGTIGVLNRCHDGSLDGRVRRAFGKAWVPDPAQPGKLKVQFFWPFTGDYWVLEVGDAYEYAVVGSPSRKAAWVLSRTPTMDPELYQEILDRLTARGYDVSRLERTLQRE